MLSTRRPFSCATASSALRPVRVCCQHAEHREAPRISAEHAAQPSGISRRQALLGAAAVAGALSAAASGRLPEARADTMMAPEGSVGPAGGTDLPQMDAVKRVGKVIHSEEEWKQLLSPAQYAVLRQANTERAFSSPLYEEHRVGTFDCAGCSSALFSSATKYSSGTGWPSFFEALPGAVTETNDFSIVFMPRTEVRCSTCQGHLGHVFRDGPPPTNLRYCMNGLSLAFVPAEAAATT